MLYGSQVEKVCSSDRSAIRGNRPKTQVWLLALHDLKAKLKEKGVDFSQDCLIYEVCNPQQAKKAGSKPRDLDRHALPVSLFTPKARA